MYRPRSPIHIKVKAAKGSGAATKIVLVRFALATLKIALNGWKLTILLLLVTGLGAVNLCTRPPPPAFGH